MIDVCAQDLHECESEEVKDGGRGKGMHAETKPKSGIPFGWTKKKAMIDIK